MRHTSLRLAALASLAFVALGLPDGLLGVAWPSMRATFGLPLDALGPLLACYTGGYVVAGFGGGWLVARLGLGRLLVASCLATGLSLLGYAASGSWTVVLLLAVVAGLGAGGIDTGINTHAATHHGPRLLNGLHACYGIGATGGPVIVTSVLASGLPWQCAYLIVGGLQLGLAALFFTSRDAWRAPPSAHGHGAPTPATLAATLRLPTARWGILLFLAYTGLELAIGAWSYTLLTDGRGLSMAQAGSSVSLYWAGLTVGRVVGAVLGASLSARALVRTCCALLALGLALLASGQSPALDVAGLVLTGLAAGPVFPTLIASTPARVGPTHAANAMGCQIAAAAIGQSLLPSLLGVAGRHAGLEVLAAGLVALAGLVIALHSVTGRTGHDAHGPSPSAVGTAGVGRQTRRGPCPTNITN